MLNRREFLQATGGVVALGALGAAACTPSPPPAAPSRPAPGSPSPRLPAAPHFPDRHFDVTAFGADRAGSRDSGDAFARAIAACSAAGGGHLRVPAGDYLTGPLVLRSGVDLHLERGSAIRFSQDPQRYLPAVLTTWSGYDVINYAPFISALGEHDVGLTGEGVLDGQADTSHWWPWSGQFGWSPGQPNENADYARLISQAAAGVPVEQRVYGAGHYLRPSFFEPYRCRRVLVSGITVLNAPFWVLHPTLCEDVTVTGVTVRSPAINNDGCDPESCSRVLISGCTFVTGDDCVAVKSGRDADGRRRAVPSRHVTVENCSMQSRFAALAIGSDMSGGVSDVLARGLRVQAAESGLFVKTNSLRGGYVRDVVVDGLTAESLDFGVRIDLEYGLGPGHGFDPSISGITVLNAAVRRCGQPVSIDGLAAAHVSAVTLDRCSFTSAAQPSSVRYADGVTFNDVTVSGSALSP